MKFKCKCGNKSKKCVTTDYLPHDSVYSSVDGEFIEDKGTPTFFDILNKEFENVVSCYDCGKEMEETR